MSLPEELNRELLNQLGLLDLIRLAITNRQYRNLVERSQSLSRRLREIPVVLVSLPESLKYCYLMIGWFPSGGLPTQFLEWAEDLNLKVATTLVSHNDVGYPNLLDLLSQEIVVVGVKHPVFRYLASGLEIGETQYPLNPGLTHFVSNSFPFTEATVLVGELNPPNREDDLFYPYRYGVTDRYPAQDLEVGRLSRGD